MNVEYSIISPGTERAGSKGYMSVSELNLYGQRYISPIGHSFETITNLEECLVVSKGIDINSIAVARFQMITALALSQLCVQNDDVILITGAGPVGMGAYWECKRQNIKNSILKTRRAYIAERYRNDITFCRNNANICANILIECTGENCIIQEFYNQVKPHGTILQVGTPRSNPMIDLLRIHRNGIKLIGVHELQFSKERRENLINQIVKWHDVNGMDFSRYVSEMPNRDMDIQNVYNHKTFTPFNIVKH